MKQLISKKFGVMGVSLILWILTSCGSSTGSSSGTPTYVSSLARGSDSIDYLLNVLKSTFSASPTSLVDNANFMDLNLAETQDSSLKDCSVNGEPWDKATNARMLVTNSNFSRTVFYCQSNSKYASGTNLGSLNTYKAALCDLERTIGDIQYSDAGTAYSNKLFSVTASCGWSDSFLSQMIGQQLTGTLTAYSLTSGDWQKRVHVQVSSQNLDYNVYFTIKNEAVAFKVLDAWAQSKKASSTDYNSFISSTATGTKVSLLSMDISSSIFRMELSDSYTGRHSRQRVVGTVSDTGGTYTTISNGQGVISAFDYKTNFVGEVVSFKGNSTDGFLHGTYPFQCSTNCTTAIRSNVSLGTKTTLCSKTSGCTDLSDFSFSATSSDLDYLMNSVLWDSQQGSKSTIETWGVSAGIPNFSEVTKAASL